MTGEGKQSRHQISIFGVGYVGTVSAACLANDGNTVVAVDLSETKVDLINRSQSPIIERGLNEMIAPAVKQGLLRATTSAEDAIKQTNVTMVCVGTPSRRDGGLDLSALERVCDEIGHAIAQKAEEHLVIVRSTVLPGSMRQLVIPRLEATSSRSLGNGLLVCNNPEFLREGSAVEDFYNPPQTVLGGSDERALDMAAAIYANLTAPLIRTSFEVAELVKYASNSWHAVKVSFANEMGNICKELGIDSHKVMDIFVNDGKLNLSAAYLRPGFAFGGSCLPKDVRALTSKARSLGLELPLLNSVLPSNRQQVQRALAIVLEQGKRSLSFLGFSFKAGTDDLRESPQVELIEQLIGKGYDVRLYDRNVQLARLTGANRAYIMHSVPHLASLMVETLDEALAHGEIVVVGNTAPEFGSVPARLRPDQLLIDLVRLPTFTNTAGSYYGINW
jgi:GDP-mannose 6-dehydrogenase